MRSRARRLTLIAVVVTAFTNRVARADTPDSVAAETQFRSGRASADAGDYPRACAAFSESQRLDPAPGTLLNLADCEEHLGRVASAEAHFRELESALPATDERRPIAHERAAALAPRVPWVTIALATGTPGDARVFRDDVEVDDKRLAAPWPVDPGPHSVLVVVPGRESRSTAIVAGEGDRLHIVVSAGPVVAGNPAVTAVTPPDRTAAWLVGTAGLVSLGVGAYFGGRALAERSASDASCSRGACANAAGLATYESALGDARAADVALGLGVAALAVTGVLLLTSGSGTHSGTALQLTRSGLEGTW